jgi:hypothetical protein
MSCIQFSKIMSYLPGHLHSSSNGNVATIFNGQDDFCSCMPWETGCRVIHHFNGKSHDSSEIDLMLCSTLFSLVYHFCGEVVFPVTGILVNCKIARIITRYFLFTDCMN